MEEKIKITEDNYREVVLKRSIILCWVLLAICFVIKIFGGNFFAIVCTNEKFIKVCEFVDKYYIGLAIEYISYLFYSFLIIRCVKLKCKNSKNILVVILLTLYWVFKLLYKLNLISISIFIYDILDFVILYLSCLLCYNKNDYNLKSVLKPILFIILIFVFSMVSAIIKNIGYKGTINDSFLVGFIFMIDYYIMLILNYLYQKRRFIKWELGVGFTGSAKT